MNHGIFVFEIFEVIVGVILCHCEWHSILANAPGDLRMPSQTGQNSVNSNTDFNDNMTFPCILVNHVYFFFKRFNGFVFYSWYFISRGYSSIRTMSTAQLLYILYKYKPFNIA